MGVTPTGTMKRCKACAMSKSKHKPVKKFTTVKATKPGERVFIDAAGPYPLESMEQSIGFKLLTTTPGWDSVTSSSPKITLEADSTS